MKKTKETVVLIDCGYGDIQKFARGIRSQHIYTMVMPYSVSAERVMEESPVGIIIVADKTDAVIAEKIQKFAAMDLPKIAVNAAADMLPALDKVTVNDPLAVDEVCKFCREKCGCTGSWRMETFVDEAVADIRELVGDQTVVLGLSGGVDSSVVAALIHKAIGDRLTCVFVNHGLLRKNEPEMVREVFEGTFNMKLVYVDATDRFLDKLAGVNEPERKRKIIGKEFIDVFAEAAESTKACLRYRQTQGRTNTRQGYICQAQLHHQHRATRKISAQQCGGNEGSPARRCVRTHEKLSRRQHIPS